MKGFSRFPLIFSAVAFFSSLVSALPAPVPEAGVRGRTGTKQFGAGLKAAATGYLDPGQAASGGIGYGAFDEFSNINDPLYREGAKELLKANSLRDGAAKPLKRPAFRDAPSDGKGKIIEKKRSPRQKTRPAIRKRKTVKPLQVDPVKSKDML